jgi:site-specific DNA recombinase
MTKADKNFAKDALLQYSREYLLKKRKGKQEKALLEDESPRYVIYARKSTEDEKRQVGSIPNQIDLCSKYAKDNNLVVADIVSEEKSAKKPGKRDVFNMVLENINKGETYDSILAWHPDRLARNMKEAGEIMDMLDSGKIKDLKFVSYTFVNDAAGKMSLSILFAMAKEFSDKLSVDTKRGVRKKIKEGKYCGSKKRGYTTNSSDYFIPDDEKYPLYRDLWKLAMKGKSLDEIKKKYPNEKVTYDYLKDPFAAGVYCYGDQIVDIENVHTRFKPLVTPQEFLTVQRNFRNRGGWTLAEDFLPFREFVKCKYCGNYMTPGRSRSKSKQQYLYMVCANRNCTEELKQKGRKQNRIRSKEVLEFIVDFLKTHKDVSKDLYKKVIENDKKHFVDEMNEIKKQIGIQRREITKLEEKERLYSDKLLSEDNAELFKDRISSILHLRKERKEELRGLEVKLSELEARFVLETPDYETFLNFFEKLVPAIQKTDNPLLLDNMMKLVFLNTTVGDKKVLGYELNQPFKSFWSMKNGSGVDDGT